jgi:DNA-binding NarL/FixJ family response regulator
MFEWEENKTGSKKIKESPMHSRKTNILKKNKKDIRVLCVTDQDHLKKIVRKNLGKLFDLSIVSSGEKGMAMATAKRPHLVLMDLGMHRLSGVDTARMIKHTLPKTDIIMLTMYQCDSCPTGI